MRPANDYPASNERKDLNACNESPPRVSSPRYDIFLVRDGGCAQWVSLFDGESLDGWRASESETTWSVKDGSLVADGPRSHLFYEGDISDHTFRNFELEVELKAIKGANSGVFFHTAFQESGFPRKGHEVQVNNSHRGEGDYRELKRTGSLYAVRNIHCSRMPDDTWFTIKIRVVGKRVRAWVDDIPTVDYFETDDAQRAANRAGRLLSRRHDRPARP